MKNFELCVLVWFYNAIIYSVSKRCSGMVTTVGPDPSDLGLHCLLSPICPCNCKNFYSTIQT